MTRIRFGEEETIKVAELAVGDFLIGMTSQDGVRGFDVNLIVESIEEDWNTWGCGRGRRHSATPIQSRYIHTRGTNFNIPAHLVIKVRRPAKEA